jgi:hypothetical protein
MSDWRKEEQELEQLIRDSRETLVVFLGESYHPGAHAMANRLRALNINSAEVRLIELTFSMYSHWAHHHEVHGTPALVVFREGELVLRIHGVFDEEKLLGFLNSTI